MYVRYMKRWLTWLKISDGHHTTPALSVSKPVRKRYGLRTTDCGLGIKYGLGIKRGLRTADWV